VVWPRTRAGISDGFASKEAEDVARVLGTFPAVEMEAGHNHLQEIVTLLHQSQHRDVVLTDRDQRILADSNPENIGKIFSGDARDEVGETIKDGRCVPLWKLARIIQMASRKL